MQNDKMTKWETMRLGDWDIRNYNFTFWIIILIFAV